MTKSRCFATNFPKEFGKEDMEKIFEKYPDLLKDTINKKEKSISYLIKQIHCNPELPEYNNIYIPNISRNFIKVSDGEKFIYQQKKCVIKELIEDKQRILEDYVDKNGEKLGNKLLKLYDAYSNYVDENDENMKDVEEKITCLLLNMKDVIEKNEKDRINYKLLENDLLEI